MFALIRLVNVSHEVLVAYLAPLLEEVPALLAEHYVAGVGCDFRFVPFLFEVDLVAPDHS